MALQKVTYVNGETVITAENLNDIQDAIIDLENTGSSSDIFWATYNSTTEAEITAAVDSGKIVATNISNEIFYLVSKAAVGPSGSAWVFASANQTSLRFTFVSGSYWNSIGTRTIPTNTSELTNDSGFQTATQVENAIDQHLSAVYKAAGSVASIAALPAPSASYLGYVYDVESAFTTTADFVEGAGIEYPAGTDVAIIAVQSGGTTTYKYDALSGFVDLSGYIQKPSSATAGQFLVYDGTDWAATTVPFASGVSF